MTPGDLQWPLPEHAFEVRRAGAVVEVREIGLPKPIGIDPKYRACRVEVGWSQGEVVPTIRDGCHPNLAEAVADAADRWVIDVPTPPGRDRELFEYWYVFPVEKGGAVRVYVRQAFDAETRIAIEGIHLLDWDVKGRVFPEYPVAAIGVDTTLTECTAKVDIAASGLPGEIAVTGCDEVFHAETADSLRRWRFQGSELDGVPFPSGVTFGVRYSRNVDYDPQARADSSGEVVPPGTGVVLLPPDPDTGGRSVTRVEEPTPPEREPPPNPTWPALFFVDHRSYAEMGVYDVRWPEPLAGEEERTCDVLFQVNSQRIVIAWTERACDEEVRQRTEVAANGWNLKHGKIERGERFARFRGTFVFPADGGHPTLRIPEEDLLTPAKLLPEFVETYVVARPYRRVPPSLPRGFATEVLDAVVTCEYDVTVGASGRPAEVAVRECPGGFGPYAEKAIRQWRWTPAESDGKPISSHTVVRVVFEQPG